MKNGRTISVKDPRLQKIRNNIRLLILNECARRKSEITAQKHDLTHDKDGKIVRNSLEDDEVLQGLTDKWWDIERPLRVSAVKCAGCGKHDRDVTYHRKSRSWFCVRCYKHRYG